MNEKKQKRKIRKRGRAEDRECLLSCMSRDSRIVFAGAALLTAAAMALTLQPFAVTAYASPSFARTAEQWATLEDDTLAWDEIPDLVTEYNATVLNNRRDLQDDMGKDAQEIRDSLIADAEDLDDLASEYEGTDGGSMTAASYRAQAEQLRQSADNNTADIDVLRWEDAKTEASVVQTVKTCFISYYQAQLEKASAEAKLPYLEKLLASAETKLSVGTGTTLDVLTARENLQTAQASLATADSTISSYKKKMQVLCGWKYDADPVIGELPEYDMSSIASIDVAADKEKALTANWQLMSDERRLQNAPSDSLRSQYQKTVETDRQQIRASVQSAYDSLVLAKTTYDTSVTQLMLSRQTLEKASRQLALGTISQMEYASYENDVTTQENALKEQELAVFSAWVSYDLAVNGLASTGTTG